MWSFVYFFGVVFREAEFARRFVSSVFVVVEVYVLGIVKGEGGIVGVGVFVLVSVGSVVIYIVC